MFEAIGSDRRQKEKEEEKEKEKEEEKEEEYSLRQECRRSESEFQNILLINEKPCRERNPAGRSMGYVSFKTSC